MQPTTSSLTNDEKAKLWAAADKLRGHMDAAEYKHTVLGLIFLKYISDAFEEHYAGLEAQQDPGIDPEDKDEYAAEGIFWVPKDARWSILQANAHQSTIGTIIDGAMESLERENPSLRDRSSEILFIDARKLGRMEDRTHRTLDPADIARIADTYHAWRGDDGAYADVPGFCKAATLAEVRDHVLTPGRYVGAEAVADDGVPFADKMARLTAALDQQFAESARLEAVIRTNLVALRIESMDGDRP